MEYLWNFSWEECLIFTCSSCRFEGKLVMIMEHFHTILRTISSRIRAEQFKVTSSFLSLSSPFLCFFLLSSVISLSLLPFLTPPTHPPTQRRVLACMRAWDTMSVYHFNLVDKLRETFIGKTQEEMEKQRAFVSG